MDDIFIGKGEQPVYLLNRYANRHGLIAGATGTGKSVSLMLLAEGFSRRGVPVFVADAKGDLAGLSQPGTASPKLDERLESIGVEGWSPSGNPVVFWDIYGAAGHPVRATISDMGPLLLARLLELTDIQSGVLEVIFKAADEEGLLLLDLKDLRALVTWAAENSKALSQQYGLVSSQSLSAIQRALLSMEQAGGDLFFGEPALELDDLMRQDLSGRGVINILAADRLILKPRLYTTFLLWLLSELFEQLPEVGDLEKPKLVFFFDEAHLLFNDAPPALRQRVEQVVRLIRSKGVGVYFCSQNPDDLPGPVLGQMGNRIQHALRAFTPRDQKAVRAAAETFAANPELDVRTVIGTLAVGEALVSTLQEGGIPLPVEQVLMSTPTSRMGAISDEERSAVRARSPVGSKYDTMVDRESAYELLQARAEEQAAEEARALAEAEAEAKAAAKAKAEAEAAQQAGSGATGYMRDMVFGTRRRQGMLQAFSKTLARRGANQVSNMILRSILGSRSRR